MEKLSPEMIRFDWMQDLLEWFDWYLKGDGWQPELHVEIQSNQGEWRIEDRYPAEDTTEVVLTLGTDLERISGGSNVLPGASTGPVHEAPLNLTCTFRACHDYTSRCRLQPLADNFTHYWKIVMVAIVPSHAIMDLRYHEGGDELSSTWTPVIGTITAMMEFIAMDAEVYAGHTIRLTLLSTGEDYLPASTSSIVTIQEGEGSTLQLDTYDPSDKLVWVPPVCTMSYVLLDYQVAKV